jgi:hypothetical protein
MRNKEEYFLFYQIAIAMYEFFSNKLVLLLVLSCIMFGKINTAKYYDKKLTKGKIKGEEEEKKKICVLYENLQMFTKSLKSLYIYHTIH